MFQQIAAAFGAKLFEIALPILITTLAGLAVAFLTKKLQSLGITVDQQQQQQLKDLAVHTALALEEQARRTPGLLSGQAKDSIAVATIQKKLPNVSAADVRQALDAALPTVRERATPSTPATFGRTATDPLPRR